MSLKQIIKRQKLLALAPVDAELVLPGEPMIYSIKYSIGSRTRSTQFFRDQKWKSLLKSYFRSYYKTNIPVVVVVSFFVSPPDAVNIKPVDLKKESVPAVYSYEVCDYLLSFLEMLHHVLINSYRQVVKIDVQKFYSSNPRTVFKFMKWDQYVDLQNHNTIHAKSQKFSENRKVWELQPEFQGNAQDEAIREGESQGTELSDNDRSVASDSPLQNTGPVKPAWKKTKTAKLPPTREETRRRQSGEVFE